MGSSEAKPNLIPASLAPSAGCIWKCSSDSIPPLQACTLARRNADVFLKYLHRNSVNVPGMLSHVKAPEQQVKSESRRCPSG